MKTLSFVYIILIVFLFFTCKSNKPKEETTKPSNYAVNFSKATKLEDVLSQAVRENKLVYLDIGASWCAPCKEMKKNVYTDKEVGEILNRHFISYIVDGEKGQGPDLNVMYDVKSYPSLFVLDSKGRILNKMESSLSQSGLIEFLSPFIKE